MYLGPFPKFSNRLDSVKNTEFDTHTLHTNRCLILKGFIRNNDKQKYDCLTQKVHGVAGGVEADGFHGPPTHRGQQVDQARLTTSTHTCNIIK